MFARRSLDNSEVVSACMHACMSHQKLGFPASLALITAAAVVVVVIVVIVILVVVVVVVWVSSLQLSWL